MWRASWKSLLARKLRLMLSAFAVVLGVAFVAGSLVFTDTLGKSFDGIMSGSVGDVVVRAKTVGRGAGPEGGGEVTIPGSLVAQLRSTPGARRVDGNVLNAGTFVVSSGGKLIGGTGAPGIAVNHTGAPAAHGAPGAELQAGHWPTKPGEVVLDERTAESAGYVLGSEVPFVSSGPTDRFSARLVGTARFGGGSLAGASMSVWETKRAQDLFLKGKDAYATVWVTAAPGVSQEELRAEVAKRLPTDLVAKTGDDEAEAAASQIQKALGFVNTFLLVFAGIALVVGTFIIVNTFSILVAQRSRELALYRAIGASRRQVIRSVLVEAVVVGLVGSALGLLLGLALAMGIKVLFAQFGLDLSATALVVAPRTVVVSFVVGILVTVLAALFPARRAGQVPPVAAMRDDVVLAETGMRRRVIGGLVLIALGAGALGWGLFADTSHPTYWVGAGILGVVLGVAATSPVVGRPVIAGLGLIYRRLFGAVGRMAEQNAQRNPRRTAATASALMIGVTLVTMMSVFGASAKASVDKAISDQFVADYAVSNAVGMPFSPKVIDDMRTVPGVKEVARLRYSPVEIEGDRTYTAAVDPTTIEAVQRLRMTSGSLSALTRDTVLVMDEVARSDRLRVGSVIDVTSGVVTRKFRVAGIYTRSTMIGTNEIFSLDGFTALKIPARDSMGYVVRDPGADPVQVKRALDTQVKDMPLVSVLDQGAFAEQQRAPIDQMLYMIYALLGLAVVIAVLGIVNTLSLSVIERTREVGLLRAVGLSRRQLRSMLRLESVAIALLGAALGVGLGVAFGIALQRSLSDEGIDVLSIPTGQLGGFVAVAAVVGVLAALWPGRRAARLDVLRAITTE